jgi:hypothetical protein
MTNIYMTINDEQRKRLAEWKAANADNPKFKELMEATARAHAAMVKLAEGFNGGPL